jgi:hypothetical protein
VADWWKKIWRKGEAPADDKPSAGDKTPAKAKWLAADDPGNPFGVELLDLMFTQTVIATTADPKASNNARSAATRRYKSPARLAASTQ